MCVCLRRTDEDEGKGDPKSQDVASERLVVLPVTFSEDAQTGVDVVLTQSLWRGGAEGEVCISTNGKIDVFGRTPPLTWKTLGALTSEARAEDSVAEKIPAVMIGPNPDTMLITWATHSEGWALGGGGEGLTLASPYLEVVVEAVLAAVFRALAAGEVEAELAGGVGAVGQELGTERVVQAPAGVPHDAGPWCQGKLYIYTHKGRIQKQRRRAAMTLPVEMATPRYTTPVMSMASRVPLGMASWGSCDRRRHRCDIDIKIRDTTEA